MSDTLRVEYVDPASVDPATLRPCGECYACCIWLGVTELKKWPGQACTKLDGASGECTRCSIYDSRPSACTSYSCAWRGGFGGDECRPDKSGILVTTYLREHLGDIVSTVEDLPPVAATIVIIDRALSGTLEVGWLAGALDALIREGIDDIRVVDYKTKPQLVIHFLRGHIYKGTVLKSEPGQFEQLAFVSHNPPIGHYERKKVEE